MKFICAHQLLILSLVMLAACDRANQAAPQSVAASAQAAPKEPPKPPPQPGRVVKVLDFDVLWAVGFSEGLAKVEMNVGDSKLVGFINTQGRIVIEPKFSEASYFKQGRCRVMVIKGKKRQSGFIDTTGAVIVEPQFDRVSEFHEDLAMVANGSEFYGFKVGYVGLDGKTVLPLQYRGGVTFGEGWAAVATAGTGGRLTYIDRTGAVVLTGPFDSAGRFREGLAAFRVGDMKTGLWGFIDKQGKRVIEPRYAQVISSFQDGRAIVYLAGKSTARYAIIDKQGQQVGPFFAEVAPFSEGLAAVRVGEGTVARWGFVDLDGKLVIEPIYDKAASFREGLAGVRIGNLETGKWGFIDKSGKMIIEPQYFQSRDFSTEPKGKPILFDVPPFFEGGLAVVRRAADMKWAIIARE